MKKAFAFVLLLVYFVVSTGFVVSVHYCMDKIKSLQLGERTRKACDECGMPIKDNKGCCKDKVSLVKMQLDQTVNKFAKADFSIPAIDSSTAAFLFTPVINTKRLAEPTAHGPPLIKQYTYLQNCVFRL